jgi:hypothetical protein
VFFADKDFGEAPEKCCSQKKRLKYIVFETVTARAAETVQLKQECY